MLMEGQMFRKPWKITDFLDHHNQGDFIVIQIGDVLLVNWCNDCSNPFGPLELVKWPQRNCQNSDAWVRRGDTGSTGSSTEVGLS